MDINVASQKVKRILKDATYDRKVLAKSGNMNFNRLAMHKSSKYLFTKPQAQQSRKYHVELLLDASGSMWGNMFRPSCIKEACQAVEKTAKLIGPYTDLNITLFNYLETTVPWKEFEAEKYMEEDMYGKYAAIHQGEREIIVDFKHKELYPGAKVEIDESLGGNWEMCNIINAVDRLKQKDGKRVLLIFLDGSPNLDDHDTDEDNVFVAGQSVLQNPRDKYHEKIESFMAQGITVIAYGIMTERPEQYYPNFYLIEDPDKMYEVLIRSLEDHLT